MNAVQRVPVPLIEHRLSPDEILRRIQSAEADCDRALARSIAVPDAARTFENTAGAMEQAVASYSDAAQRLQILKDVHPDAKVRAAAATAEESAGKYLVKIASRRDLYRATKAFVDGNGQREALDAEQQRLLQLAIRDFRRNGLELSDADLARLVGLRTRLTELSTEFQRNLNENVDRIEVSEAELQGLPHAYVERLAHAPGGRRVVTTKYPDFIPFMENAASGEARARLFLAFQSREASRNLPLLKEAIRLRDEEAKLLGYQSHADFVTEDQMAKTAGAVAEFLTSLQAGLKPRRDRDVARMTELKRAETSDPSARLEPPHQGTAGGAAFGRSIRLEPPHQGTAGGAAFGRSIRLEPWDVAYYLNQIKKRDFALDTEQIREFFPAETVLRGMFEVYEQLLSIAIREVPGVEAWASGVNLYSIHDRPSGELVGHFYTDLFPRDGKYGHAASAPVTTAREVSGAYLSPIAVLMANFNPPSGGRPSLLSHDEVETLFHEFGHIMHQTLTTARYGSQSGSAVARDFVEAPSQMLENWVYEKPVLDRMSGHFQDPSRKLSAQAVDRIKQARTFDAGWRYTRQVFLATFDQRLHTAGAQVDPDSLDQALYAEILGLAPVRGGHFAATFGHLMGGYDAGYYGYLWAEVFADDLYTRFEERGILDAEVGRQYRDIILAKGRSEEPEALLRQFLGRAPSNAAFLRKLGIDRTAGGRL
jgi:thimet oligopeptidase